MMNASLKKKASPLLRGCGVRPSLSPLPPHPPKGASRSRRGPLPRPLSPPASFVLRLVSPLFCSVGLYAHCHWWCPPCLIRRYRVVLVYQYSRINSKGRLHA